jgi:2-keto-4-pentenoate hydratase/2-oxohepta-3-ene-1,7-dioic acid hydratase (catechol pathway)
MEKYMRCVCGGRVAAGRVDGETLRLIEGSFPESFRETGETIALADIEETLPPVQPNRIVAIGLNYRDHAKEFNLPVPSDPVSFLVATSAAIGHMAYVKRPGVSKELSYEAELAVVIGKGGSDIAEDKAMGHVFGYTCANDVTARDVQRQDGQWCRSKSYPTFKPLGPWIVTGLDPSDLAVISRVNGEIRQSSRTSNLIFPVPRLMSFLSSFMPLLPGDVVITGTPSGVGLVDSGDVMEIEVEGVGVLKNVVA